MNVTILLCSCKQDHKISRNHVFIETCPLPPCVWGFLNSRMVFRTHLHTHLQTAGCKTHPVTNFKLLILYKSSKPVNCHVPVKEIWSESFILVLGPYINMKLVKWHSQLNWKANYALQYTRRQNYYSCPLAIWSNLKVLLYPVHQRSIIPSRAGISWLYKMFAVSGKRHQFSLFHHKS